MNALSHKVWADLRQHRARTILTICTLGVALGGLGTLAVPGLMNASMQREVQESRLASVVVTTHNIDLNAAERYALRDLPNVAAFDPQIEYSTSAMVGSDRVAAVVWGINFNQQSVDKVQLATGSLPGDGQVLFDTGDGAASGLTVAAGNDVAIRTDHGTTSQLDLTGSAHSLATSPSAAGSNSAVFYASASTVRKLSGIGGYNVLAFRLTHNTAAAQRVLISEVRHYLTARTGHQPFVGLPTTRANGTWPGRSSFLEVVSLFYVITALALLCALFLIANTMNTLVVEQGAEVAVLKALGGRRRQIKGVVLRTAALLGIFGAVVGAALGIVIASLLTDFFASNLFDVHATFAVSIPVVIGSLVLGPALAVVSTLPGLRRAVRRPVAEVLSETAGSGYGGGAVDRMVARIGTFGGPTRLGLRNVLRQKRRSVATVCQITLAVALGLGLFAAGQSATSLLGRVYGHFHYQVEVDANPGAPLLNARALAIARATPGVKGVEPVVETGVEYRGQEYPAYGIGPTTLYQYELSAGTWFHGTETKGSTSVVLGPSIAKSIDASVGARLNLQTASGLVTATVIGIDTGQWDNGSVMYFDLPALQRLAGMDGAENALWLTTTNTSHFSVNRVTNDVESRLGARGFPVQVQKLYVEAAQNLASNNQIVTIIEVLGLLVGAITLLGLVGTLTMGVIERRREIGVLRSLGASSRQVRQVFSVEGLVMAVLGWSLGSLLGWPLTIGLLKLIGNDFGVNLPSTYRLVNVPEAFIALIIITWLTIRAPLRRAARVQPSVELRYQ